MGIDPRLMNTFLWKMMNPVHWRRVRSILYSYNHAALQDPYAVGTMVDQLCSTLGVPITPGQRAAAIRFVIAQRCDPHNPHHRARMWNLVFG
ncbi:hypothetical protein LLE49_20290 [Alicyclobacillus tolerans]|uniref:hypothetical protein n=1 Tax=Alicyclobacillus tolerans TaxID=90970 RepID=UPI001F15C8EF|nr:hypothetical protein [Alicyclobacillus tolerans]MCF8567065.1 hypothetical protein [Alicyclobacillus tolerans]